MPYRHELSKAAVTALERPQLTHARELGVTMQITIWISIIRILFTIIIIWTKIWKVI